MDTKRAATKSSGAREKDTGSGLSCLVVKLRDDLCAIRAQRYTTATASINCVQRGRLQHPRETPNLFITESQGLNKASLQGRKTPRVVMRRLELTLQVGNYIYEFTCDCRT
jgi:hypothetical protein